MLGSPQAAWQGPVCVTVVTRHQLACLCPSAKFGRGVADLGSDPNSVRDFEICQRRSPELGSDPNSAGHPDGASDWLLHWRFRAAASSKQSLVARTDVDDSVNCAHAVADLGSDPNSVRDLEICQRCLPELGSDPNSAGHPDGASDWLLHWRFRAAASSKQSLVARTDIDDSVNCAHAVADLGSDPNSVRDLEICQRRSPELGSDPNSAGQHRHVACPRRIRFLGSSPYAACAARYKINSKTDLRRDCFHGKSATSLHRTDRSAVRVARRIGV